MLLRNRRRLQAALAKVSMPKKTSRDGPPGTPWRAERFQLFRRGTLAKLLHFLHCCGECEITRGPDVRPPKGTQEINVGSPLADAFEGDEHFARGIVVEIVQVVQVEVVARERFREQARVQRFLAAKADAQQFHVVQPQESSGSERLHGRFQSLERGARRCQGHLLFEDDVDKRRKAWLAHPQLWPPVLFDDSRQMFVPICQKQDASGKNFFIQNVMRVLHGSPIVDARREFRLLPQVWLVWSKALVRNHIEHTSQGG